MRSTLIRLAVIALGTSPLVATHLPSSSVGESNQAIAQKIEQTLNDFDKASGWKVRPRDVEGVFEADGSYVENGKLVKEYLWFVAQGMTVFRTIGDKKEVIGMSAEGDIEGPGRREASIIYRLRGLNAAIRKVL